MRLRTAPLCVVALLLSTVPAAAGEPRLGSGRWLMSFSWYPHDEVSSTLGGMQLSPDGETLLFARHEPGLNEDGSRSERWRPALMAVAGRQRRDLAVAPLLSEEMVHRWLHQTVFQPGGSRIALPGPGGTAALVDLATGAASPIRVQGAMVLPAFDGEGRTIVATVLDRGAPPRIVLLPLREGQPRTLTIRGNAGPACPADSVLPVVVDGAGDRAARLVLASLGGQREVTVHEAGSGAEIRGLHWTGDGRYLYLGELDRSSGDRRTLVWDRVRSRPAGTIPGALPVGGGPTATSMVLAAERAEGQDVLLHDAARDRSRPVGHVFPNLITAARGRVVFIDRLDENEFDIVLGEISR